jgi:hypothetical protein
MMSAETATSSVVCTRGPMDACKLVHRLLRPVSQGLRPREAGRRRLGWLRRRRAKPRLRELRVHRQGVRRWRRVRVRLSIWARILGLWGLLLG